MNSDERSISVKRSTIIRYVVSGATATAVMFGSLVLLREVFGFWYLYASTLSCVLAFITSFLLQKLWTFREYGAARAHTQFVLFLLISIANIGLNGAGMVVLVERVGLWYLLSQVFVSAGIAFWSFFAYRWIFATRQPVGAEDK